MLKARHIIASLVLATVAVSGRGFAHGDDRPGPHGGHVRMPGAYHTELVPFADKTGVKVYLLDISFADPVTEQSWVRLIYETEDATSVTECAVKDDYFECRLPTGAKLDTGKFVISSSRRGSRSTAAVYSLPLEYRNAAH